MNFSLSKSGEEIIEYDDPHAVTPMEYNGSGTEADPYIIESTENLQQLIQYVNRDDYAGKYFRLTKDILNQFRQMEPDWRAQQ